MIGSCPEESATGAGDAGSPEDAEDGPAAGEGDGDESGGGVAGTLVSGDGDGDGGAAGAAVVSALSGDLPFTGLPVWLALLLGAVAVGMGFVLRHRRGEAATPPTGGS
ncbi:MAG: hypothetical protein KY396_06710 [Actinobacteria bacterium]|nr:hypothetical protein [Actinomycetota bacterium]